MRRAMTLLALLTLAGCDLSMQKQARHDPQSGALWPGGPSAGDGAPPGSIAVDQPAIDAASARPPHVTPALLARGQDRYQIFCTPCHGATGHGDGRVVQRGFPRPPSFASPQFKGWTPRQTFAAITRGYGDMYPFADRITPADRWAIAAYVAALKRVPETGDKPS